MDGCVSSSNHTYAVILEALLSDCFGATLQSSGAFSVDSQRPAPYTFVRYKLVPIKALSGKGLLQFKGSAGLLNLAREANSSGFH